MSVQPVILVVDDDMTSLTITEQELRKRYGRDYRVLARQSAAAALDELRRLKIEGQPVALILADQVMPEMSGADFLGEARVIDPVAKRVMLVSWGDRSAPQAILTGCAVGQIEFFITKPWHTATDERFHSEVAGFLYEWARLQRPVYEAVRVVGERWAPRSHELRDLLGRNGVAYGFYDADSEEGREILRDAGLDAPPKLPVAVVFGGRVLVDPSNREVSESLGVRSRPSADECDLLVVGAGPAGLAAAVYGSSEGLSTVVLEREALGGQAGQSTMIHNYLGFPAGISGDELTFRAYEQAWQFGAEFLFSNEATSLRPDGDAHMVELADGASLRAGAVILAMGVTYRRLAVPRLDPFRGSGVFYGSVSSEARSLVDMDVYIVGGGNSAGQAAIHLAKYARHVTLVMRGDGLSDTMSHYLVSFLSNVDRISLRPRTLIVDGDGDTRLRQTHAGAGRQRGAGGRPGRRPLRHDRRRPAHRVAAARDSARRQRLRAHRSGHPRRRAARALAARAAAAGARDEPPRRVRRRRRARRLGQARGVGGRRGRRRRPARAAAPGRPTAEPGGLTTTQVARRDGRPASLDV